MDISLRDAARRVTEQSGDRQLGESQITGDAGKGVSKDVRCHNGKFRLGANPIEHSNDTDEMPVADIGWEHVGRMLLDGLAFDALDRRDADRASCSPLLMSGKPTSLGPLIFLFVLILLPLGGCAAPAPAADKSWDTPYSHEDYGLRGGGGD